MSERLDQAAGAWVAAPDDGGRASALAQMVGAALDVARAADGADAGARASWRAEVLVGTARQMEPSDQRSAILTAAMRHGEAQLEDDCSSLQALVECALLHPPAVDRVFELAHRPGSPEPGVSREEWNQERAGAIAQLVAAVAPEHRGAIAKAAVAVAEASNSSTTIEGVVEIATRAAAGSATADLLELVARLPGSGSRVATLARMVPYLPESARGPAIDEVLAGPITVGNVFTPLTAWLRPDDYPRALDLIRGLSPTRHVGARALRELLPCWAELDHFVEARDRARTIEDPGERGITLGRLVPHAPEAERESVIRETLVAFSATPIEYGYEPASLAAAIADAVVPIGYTNWLLDLSRSPITIAAAAGASSGSEREQLLADLASRPQHPDLLVPFRDELDPAILFESFRSALIEHAQRGLATFVSDEYDSGFVQWVPFLGCLGGPDGPGAVARLFV